MAKILNEKPKMVINLRTVEKVVPSSDVTQSIPWVVLTNYYKMAITCPGCGITHQLIWNTQDTQALSRTVRKPLCCEKLDNAKIRITYNNYGTFWGMNGDKMDTTAYETSIMKTFIDRYHLDATFVHAKGYWGSIDKETNLWNGVVGNVSCLLFVIS